MELKYELRKGKSKTKPNCYICNKHEGITEWHHITPIQEQVNDIKEMDGFIVFDKDFHNLSVILCPNCHTYLHKLYKTNKKDYELFFKNMEKNGYSLHENLKFCDLSNSHEKPLELEYEHTLLHGYN